MWSKCDRTLSALVKSESLERVGEKTEQNTWKIKAWLRVLGWIPFMYSKRKENKNIIFI